MESNEESKDAMISSFCNITGVEPSRGQFYLESAHWDLQLAIQSFFEHSAEDIAMDSHPNPSPNPNEDPERAEQIRQLFSSEPIVDNPSTVGQMSPKTSKKQSKSDSKPHSSSKFATLDTLRAQTDSGGSSEEEGQAFYAGGSERSGQQVLGPKKKNNEELVSNMFASAKAHGAEVVDPNEESKVKKRVNTFVGTGFKLGSTTEDSTPIQTSASSSTQRPQNREMVLKLWRNGFSLDDGSLRDYKDPQNQEFLNSIQKGEIPRELIQKAGGQEVHLNMEDHRTEEFVAPKRTLQAFSGEGHRLGTPVADVVSAAVSTISSSDPKLSESEAQNSLSVDQSQPTTSIQIRLSDGTRLVLKLNLTHTIAHIRQYICKVRPIYSAQTFVLMTTFPNKELTDETLTVKDANLANASIVLRLQ